MTTSQALRRMKQVCIKVDLSLPVKKDPLYFFGGTKWKTDSSHWRMCRKEIEGFCPMTETKYQQHF